MLFSSLVLLGGATIINAQLVPTATCPQGLTNGDTIQVSDDSNTNYRVQCDTEFVGGDLGSYVRLRTYDSCVARCDSTPGCVAAQWSSIDTHCQLKDAARETVVKPGTTAFMKIFVDPIVEPPTIPTETPNVKIIRPAVRRSAAPQVDVTQKCTFNLPNGELTTIAFKRYYQIDCNHELIGGDLGAITKLDTYGACIARCDITPGCIALNYGPIDKNCKLKSSIGTRGNKLGDLVFTLTSGGKVPSSSDGLSTRDAPQPTCPETITVGGEGYYKMACNTRSTAPADDIADIAGTFFKETSYEECLKHCDADQECQGASWNGVDEQCFVFKTPRIPIQADGWCSFFRQNDTGIIASRDLAPQACPTEPITINHKDWYTTICGEQTYNVGPSSNQAVYKAHDFQTCLTRCSEHRDCNVASWDGNNENCYLLSGNTASQKRLGWYTFVRTARAPDAEAVEVTKRDAPQHCPSGLGSHVTVNGKNYYAVDCGTASLGGDLGDGKHAETAYTYTECLQDCDGHSECIGAQWDAHTRHCWLKSAFGIPALNEDAIFFVRENDHLAERVLATRQNDSQNVDPFACDAGLQNGRDVSVNGKTYYSARCGFNQPGDNIMPAQIAPSWSACLEKCDATKGCVTATWSHIDQHCDLKKSYGNHWEQEQWRMYFVRVKDLAERDVAAPAGSDCAPGVYEGKIVSLDPHMNGTYKVRCDMSQTRFDMVKSEIVPSYIACLEKCDNTDNCVAAQWSHHDLHCEIKSQLWQPSQHAEAGNTFFSRDWPAPGGLLPPASREERDAPRKEATSIGERKTQEICPPGDFLSPDFPFSLNNEKYYQIICAHGNDGKVIGRPTIVDTYTDCVKQCDNKADCIVASYNWNNKHCHLRSEVGPANDERGAITFVWIPAPEPRVNALTARQSDAIEPQSKRGLDRNKRGIAYNDPNKVAGFRSTADSKIKWGWNWYSTPYGQNCNNDAHPGSNSMEGLTFIPNIWTSKDQCLSDIWFRNVDDSIARYRTDSLIAFNEPDMGTNIGGSDIPNIGEAVDGYRRLMMPYAGKVSLGAPATTYTKKGKDGGWEWIRNFMAACTDCRIDFIPIHYYYKSWGDVEGAIRDFQDELRWLANTLQRPIWVTEMRYTADTEHEEIWWLRAMLDFFETRDWISRYSYRTAEEMTLPDGSLSLVGSCYACFRSGGEGGGCCMTA